MTDLQKALLAVAWHSMDLLFDAMDAHKALRLGWAGVGVGWSIYWASRLSRPATGWATVAAVKEPERV